MPHSFNYGFEVAKSVCLLVCVLRRVNPCGPLASDDIKLNMIWVEKVKNCNK